MSPPSTDTIRKEAERAAEEALLRFVKEHPEVKKAEIPAPLKWAGGIVAALFTAGVATLTGWLIFTVSDMSLTLARIDERQAGQIAFVMLQLGQHAERIAELERYHKQKGLE